MIGVTIVVFTILYFSPGDPAYLALGDNATPEAVEAYRIEMGINGTYWERLGRTLLGLFQGDLGISYRSRTPVLNELLVRFSVTFNISAWSIVLGIILGIFFGIVAALKQNTILDSLCTGCALFGISMPMFWQGLMLILIFSVGLGWLPASGYGNSWTQMIMPVVALGVNSSATIMRTTRSSMLGVLLAGSIVTEVIFSINGVGKYLVDSMNARDYAAVQGCVLLIAFVSAILNLIVDIIYTFIDPRMKTMYESSKSGFFRFKKRGEKKAA